MNGEKWEHKFKFVYINITDKHPLCKEIPAPVRCCQPTIKKITQWFVTYECSIFCSVVHMLCFGLWFAGLRTVVILNLFSITDLGTAFHNPKQSIYQSSLTILFYFQSLRNVRRLWSTSSTGTIAQENLTGKNKTRGRFLTGWCLLNIMLIILLFILKKCTCFNKEYHHTCIVRPV